MNIKIVERYLIVAVIAIGIITCGTYSYAYYTIGVKENDIDAVSSNKTGPLPTVIYDAGSLIETKNMIPGDKTIKTFNVEFTPNQDFNSAKYTIDFNITNNTFTKCTNVESGCEVNASELVYRLYRQIGSNNQEEIVSETDITNFKGLKSLNETIESPNGEKIVYHYTLEIEFKETKANQNHNKNQTFNGEVTVHY